MYYFLEGLVGLGLATWCWYLHGRVDALQMEVKELEGETQGFQDA